MAHRTGGVNAGRIVNNRALDELMYAEQTTPPWTLDDDRPAEPYKEATSNAMTIAEQDTWID